MQDKDLLITEFTIFIAISDAKVHFNISLHENVLRV